MIFFLRSIPPSTIRCAVGMVLVSSLTIACSSSPKHRSVKPPTAVSKAFSVLHPRQTARWEAKPYGYEATFTQNGVEYEAEFSRNGRWLETEYEVTPNQFPKAVIDRVLREHPGFTITKYEIETTPIGQFFEVEIEQGSQEIELYFDRFGNRAMNFNEDA